MLVHCHAHAFLFNVHYLMYTGQSPRNCTKHEYIRFASSVLHEVDKRAWSRNTRHIKVLCSCTLRVRAHVRTTWVWGLPRRSACARALPYDGAHAQDLTNTFELPPALTMHERNNLW